MEETEKKVEISVLKRFDFHKGWANSLCYFPKPVNRLVSSSADKTIAVTNLGTNFSFPPQETRFIQKNSRFVRQVIKFNKEVFLACSDDSSVRSYSIKTLEMQKDFTQAIISATLRYKPNSLPRDQRRDAAVYRLLKLRPVDEFLCVNAEDLFLILSYSRTRVIKKLNLNEYRFGSNSKLVHSKSSPNHFFGNVRVPFMHREFGEREPGSVARIRFPFIKFDYKNNRLVQQYEGLEGSTYYVIETFLHPQTKEEHLVAGGSKGILLIFHAESGKIAKVVTDSEKDAQLVWSLLSFGNYLMKGDERGNLTCFTLIGSEVKVGGLKVKKMAKKCVNTGNYLSRMKMIVFLDYERSKRELKVACCSNDMSIVVSSISNINYIGNDDRLRRLELEDWNERIDYLRECLDSVFGEPVEEEDERVDFSGIFFKIKIGGVEFERMCKSFIC